MKILNETLQFNSGYFRLLDLTLIIGLSTNLDIFASVRLFEDEI